MLFKDLNSVEENDGIWACASILHLSKAELGEVLFHIQPALQPGGILYTSFKYGTYEGLRNGRCFTDYTEETLQEFWKRIPALSIEEIWFAHDVRPGVNGK